MIIRKVLVLATLCALAAVAMASSASAATFLRTGSTTGATYSGPISASQEGTATFTATDGSNQTWSCAEGAFTGSVGASGGASVTGTLSTLTFGTSGSSVCSSNFFFHDCSLVSAGAVTVTATGAGTGTFTVHGLTERCFAAGGLVICDWDFADPVGQITDKGTSGSTLSFTNVAFTSTTGGAGCPATAVFSGSYFPIRTEPGGALVYINNA